MKDPLKALSRHRIRLALQARRLSLFGEFKTAPRRSNHLLVQLLCQMRDEYEATPQGDPTRFDMLKSMMHGVRMMTDHANGVYKEAVEDAKEAARMRQRGSEHKDRMELAREAMMGKAGRAIDRLMEIAGADTKVVLEPKAEPPTSDLKDIESLVDKAIRFDDALNSESERLRLMGELEQEMKGLPKKPENLIPVDSIQSESGQVKKLNPFGPLDLTDDE